MRGKLADHNHPLHAQHCQEVSVKLRSAMTLIRAEIVAGDPDGGAKLVFFKPHLRS